MLPELVQLGQLHIKHAASLCLVAILIWLATSVFRFSNKGSHRRSAQGLERISSATSQIQKPNRKPGGETQLYTFEAFNSLSLQNGYPQTLRGRPPLHIQTGMSIRPNRYHIDHSDMARESPQMWFQICMTDEHRKYFITMGLRSMKWDEWIGRSFSHTTSMASETLTEAPELDNHYLRYHADKARRIKERGAKCCRTAPEAMDGAIELLEELCVLTPFIPA